MKKMSFAIMIATSLMTVSFANAQSAAKAPVVQQTKAKKAEKSTVKHNDKKGTTTVTKSKSMTKSEKVNSVTR